VLTTISGLPAHVLIIHAAVVFLPLLVVTAIAYALVPRVRRYVGWAAVLLAVGAPLFAFLARQSGQNFRARLIAQGIPADFISKIDKHQSYGNMTFWFSLGLGVFTLLLVALTMRSARGAAAPTWLTAVLSIVVIGFAIVTGIYVFLTGDSGAHTVWDGTLTG
jgi:amino acid transporter